MAMSRIFPHGLFARRYPDGYLLAVMEQECECDKAVAELLEVGFRSEDVWVVAGQDALALDAGAAPPAHSPRPMQPEAEEYLAAALLGDVLVAVHARQVDDANRAAMILVGYGAKSLRTYGQVEPLTGDGAAKAS